MKVNKYLNDVLSDISTVMKKPLKERNLTGKVVRQRDDSYVVSFTNGRTGLGSDVLIKILPQEKTNEYIATWASVEITVLSQAKFIVLNDLGLVFAEAKQGSKPVESFPLFERLDKPDKATALEYLANLVSMNGVSDFSVAGEKYVDRTFNRLIPELRGQLRELYKSVPNTKIDVFNDRGIYVNGKNVAASITFSDGRVHLGMDGRPALSVDEKDAAVILQVLNGYKNKDVDAHPIIAQLFEQKRADAAAAKEAENAQLQRRLEKARADVEAARRKAELLAAMQERRNYLASLPIASDDHAYAIGKTEFYDLVKGEAPWKISHHLNETAYLIENDYKLIGVAVIGAFSGLRFQWLNEDVSSDVKAAARKDLISGKMPGIVQKPIHPSDTIFATDGSEHKFDDHPSGVPIAGSLDLSKWPGRVPPTLPEHMTVTEAFLPHPEQKHLPRGLKAGYVALRGTKIETICDDVEIETLDASSSRLKVIEDGFIGKHINLSRTFYISSLCDGMNLDTLDLSRSNLRVLPRDLTVKKLNVTGSYIFTLRQDTTVTGEVIGLRDEEPAATLEDDVEVDEPTLT